MPKGGARPGAGRPRKSVASHLLTGTFRPSRHGPRPAAGHVLSLPSAEPDWRPSPADLAGLGVRAREWLALTLATYTLDAVEGAHALLALRCLDRCAALEQAVAEAGGAGVADSRLLVALDRGTRTFSILWGALRLGGKD